MSDSDSDAVPGPATVGYRRIEIKVANAAGSVTTREVYEAWKTSNQLHAGYGSTLNEALVALLNKHGE